MAAAGEELGVSEGLGVPPPPGWEAWRGVWGGERRRWPGTDPGLL